MIPPSIDVGIRGPLVMIEFSGGDQGGEQYTAGFTATQAQCLAWKLWRLSKQLRAENPPANIAITETILGGILAPRAN